MGRLVAGETGPAKQEGAYAESGTIHPPPIRLLPQSPNGTNVRTSPKPNRYRCQVPRPNETLIHFLFHSKDWFGFYFDIIWRIANITRMKGMREISIPPVCLLNPKSDQDLPGGWNERIQGGSLSQQGPCCHVYLLQRDTCIFSTK